MKCGDCFWRFALRHANNSIVWRKSSQNYHNCFIFIFFYLLIYQVRRCWTQSEVELRENINTYELENKKKYQRNSFYQNPWKHCVSFLFNQNEIFVSFVELTYKKGMRW